MDAFGGSAPGASQMGLNVSSMITAATPE